MADLHLCRCSSGPHHDMPVTVLEPGAVLLFTDPNATLSADDVVRSELGQWATDQHALVILVHDADMRLQMLTDDDLAHLGLCRLASIPIGDEPPDDGEHR